MNIPPEYLNQIVTGDARELAKRIPDNSIDLIFTDPPYPREYLHVYEWLGKESMRVLKCGGYLFCYGATEFINEQLEYLRAGGLDFFWVDVLLHNGGYPRMWHKQLLSGYKPVYVFTKGKPSLLKWRSTVDSDQCDKRFHEWGQGEGLALKVIDMLTAPRDVILEPCAGGGTVPAVCKMLGRNYVAFEIDAATAERARQRVAATQPPLFVMQHEQMELV